MLTAIRDFDVELARRIWPNARFWQQERSTYKRYRFSFSHWTKVGLEVNIDCSGGHPAIFLRLSTVHYGSHEVLAEIQFDNFQEVIYKVDEDYIEFRSLAGQKDGGWLKIFACGSFHVGVDGIWWHDMRYFHDGSHIKKISHANGS